MSKTTETVLCLVVATVIALLVMPILVKMPTAEERAEIAAEERAERAASAPKPHAPNSYWVMKSLPWDEKKQNGGPTPKQWQIADGKIYWLEQR